jgi:hypothetical protein
MEKDSGLPSKKTPEKISRRRFLTRLGASAAVGLGLAADEKVTGGALARFAKEVLLPPENLREPRLIQPVVFVAEEDVNMWEMDSVRRKIDLLMEGVREFYKKNADFNFDIKPARVFVPKGKDGKIFNLPESFDAVFLEASEDIVREQVDMTKGGTVGVFSLSYDAKNCEGRGDVDEAGSDAFVLYSGALREFASKEVTYGNLNFVARLAMHELGHTLGLKHPNDPTELTMMGSSAVVDASYYDESHPNYRNPSDQVDEKDIVSYVSNLEVEIREQDREYLSELYE